MAVSQPPLSGGSALPRTILAQPRQLLAAVTGAAGGPAAAPTLLAEET
jgi:hypothetical protein